MRRFLISAFMLLFVTTVTFAQRSVQDKIFKNAYRHHLSTMVEIFDHEMPGQCYAEWFAYADIDGDVKCELLLADHNKERIMAFKYVGDDINQVPVGSTVDVEWERLFWFFFKMYDESEGDESDMTLCHRPLFAHNIDIDKNRFKASSEVWSYVAPERFDTYNRMIFKPHVGAVKLAKTMTTGQAVTLTFALINPANTKTMFRGYASTQATPILVPEAFLITHDPLQYSRWLNGEPIQYATPDAKRIISAFYGGRRIVEARHIANCEINERHFYNVVFAPQNGEVLNAFVCIAEGEVTSVMNRWYEMNQDSRNTLETGEDLTDIFFHGPQIMAMMSTPMGLELYVRWNSMEGIHYAIWREYWDQWITIQDDYEYLVAY